jgi:uncharacterized protein YjiS (DUF1127 family)
MLAPSCEDLQRSDLKSNRYLASIQTWFRNWSSRQRLAKELEGQPDSVLADVGLTRRELEAEIAKPFWRA